MAATREDACGLEGWKPLDVGESLGILLSVFPGAHKRGVDCTLAAHNCQEADACMAYYRIDSPRLEDELHLLPECGSERTDHCEGNVAKYCVSDNDGTLHEASYDCTLAGATCRVSQTDSGESWANCQAPPLQCKGPHMPYCDGTRAVVCEESDHVLSPWVYDCRDAFGSNCVDKGNGDVQCEGPATREENCNDGIDGDGDGKIDCMDTDCRCVETQCDNGIDDNGNGAVDCDDLDCAGNPSCQ